MPAASCPISSSQLPYYRSLFRGNQSGSTTSFSIPYANDLASLLRTLNAIQAALSQLTTPLTINNLYLPRDPNYSKKGDKYYSGFPFWDQASIGTEVGVVTGKKDQTSRAAVVRQNTVSFVNRTQNDPLFTWQYVVPIK